MSGAVYGSVFWDLNSAFFAKLSKFLIYESVVSIIMVHKINLIPCPIDLFVLCSLKSVVALLGDEIKSNYTIYANKRVPSG